MVLVLFSQTRGPSDFHRARIVFRSPLDAGTFFCVEPFGRARHSDCTAATATLDLPAWRSRLLAEVLSGQVELPNDVYNARLPAQFHYNRWIMVDEAPSFV